MWLLSLTAGEYSKIGRFVNEFLLLLTFLTVRGINISKKQAGVAYALIVVVAILVGAGLKDLNTVKINNEISNKENPQIQKLLEQNEEILKLLRKE